MRGEGGGVILRFDPKTVLCGLQRAEEEGNIPPIIASARSSRCQLLSWRPMDASRIPGKILDSDCTSLAVNAREAPSPSSFDRPLNGTEGASLLVSTQGTTSSEGERSSFDAAAVEAVKALLSRFRPQQ